MANRLTGGFPAVLQVSGRTLDRLLAALHQNPAVDPARPKMPARAYIRVGDAHFGGPVDGVRGTMRVQIGAPRLELIHEATDRVGLRGWLRGWHVPDPGTAAFPELIFGEFTCVYGIVVETVSSPARHLRAPATYLHFRLLPGSVVFTSDGPDTSADSRVARQLEALLDTRYRPNPHPVIEDVKEGRFRSLVAGRVSAVVAPLAVGAPPSGADLSQVEGIVLGGADFAVAVSREHVLAMVEPVLGPIKASPPGFKVKSFLLGTAHYTTVIDQATVEWGPGGSIVLRITGRSTTPKWWSPDADFSVVQALRLGFVPAGPWPLPATEMLTLIADGPPDVSVSLSSLGFLEGLVRGTISGFVTTEVNKGLATAHPQLQATIAQKGKLIAQVRTVDPAGDARFTSAEFTRDGIILRGVLSLGKRSWLGVAVSPLAGRNGYSALSTWMPGGRVLQYRWSWY